MAEYKARQAYTDAAVVQNYEQFRFGSRLGRYTWKREQAAVSAMVAKAGPSRAVLDLPCGNGRWVSVIASSGAELIVESDVSATMLAAAGENSDLPRVQCEAERLPYADGAFDLVFCHALLKHLPLDLQAVVLAELARVSSRHLVVAISVDRGLPKLARRVHNLYKKGLSNAGTPRWLDEATRAAGLRIVAQRKCTTPVGLERSILFEKVETSA